VSLLPVALAALIAAVLDGQRKLPEGFRSWLVRDLRSKNMVDGRREKALQFQDAMVWWNRQPVAIKQIKLEAFFGWSRGRAPGQRIPQPLRPVLPAPSFPGLATQAPDRRYERLSRSALGLGGDREAVGPWAKRFELRVLGLGLRRVVLDLDGVALKLPLDKHGREQNLAEASLWASADAELRACLVPVLDSDPTGAWLTMERVAANPRWARLSRDCSRRLEQAGVLDRGADNISDDGRLLDYGLVRR
jgi:hypothetical protein